jgi:hypothetical protein
LYSRSRRRSAEGIGGEGVERVERVERRGEKRSGEERGGEGRRAQGPSREVRASSEDCRQKLAIQLFIL